MWVCVGCSAVLLPAQGSVFAPQSAGDHLCCAVHPPAAHSVWLQHCCAVQWSARGRDPALPSAAPQGAAGARLLPGTLGRLEAKAHDRDCSVGSAGVPVQITAEQACFKLVGVFWCFFFFLS